MYYQLLHDYLKHLLITLLLIILLLLITKQLTNLRKFSIIILIYLKEERMSNFSIKSRTLALALIMTAIFNPMLSSQAQSNSVSTPPKENILVRGSKDVWHGICWGPKKVWEGTKWMGRKITGKPDPTPSSN